MTELFDKLLAAAAEPDQVELKMAHNGRIQAMSAYNKSPGKSTKDDYDAARQLYDDTVERMTRKYRPDETPAPEGELFKNRKQALNWIKNQGYKVSQGKFYQDCKEGFPRIHRDGTISKFEVLQYGQQLDVETRSTPDRGKSEALKERKLELDIERLEKENRREDERWLLREAAWAAMAAIFGTLQDSLRHHFHAGQGQIVLQAGGDHNRAAEVYELTETIIGQAFNEVCAIDKIEGVFDEADN